MSFLHDTFRRRFEYLRLSITDRCNFRCAYCLPRGCPRRGGAPPLGVAEIERLVRALARLGLWKVRLTGGEPTTRGDVVEIVRRVARVPGVRRVGLTTNGYRLASLAPALAEAGLHSVNVSLDSLDPDRFERITGWPQLAAVVAGIEAALAAGLAPVKVNVVLLRGMPGSDVDRFLTWTRRLPIAVRFIELMRTGENGAFFLGHHLASDAIRDRLEREGWRPRAREPGEGPAASYGHPDHAGTAGVIAPYSDGFCASCNRLRVSSSGDLKLCLFADRAIPLRSYLRSDGQEGALASAVVRAVRAKPRAHLLREGHCGATGTLAATGG